MDEIISRLQRIREVKDTARNVYIEAMINNIDKQDDACVGIFWYDRDDDELFGVDNPYVDECKPYRSVLFNNKLVRTGRKLHCTKWEKEFHRGKDKRFSGDYTKVPRGRVFCVDDRFIVLTGNWIKQYPQVMDYVLDEFNLPEDTIFRVDSHWDLGHGWSDEF